MPKLWAVVRGRQSRRPVTGRRCKSAVRGEELRRWVRVRQAMDVPRPVTGTAFH
jgi:hypothetical protein